MAVSVADRDYMRRLGEFEASGDADKAQAHRARPLSERLALSASFCRRFRKAANLQARQDDPSPFYDRARQLGFYRP